MTPVQRSAIDRQSDDLTLAARMGTLAPQRLLDPESPVIPTDPSPLGALDQARGIGVRQLERTARMLARLGAPVIIFNASHSGSRVLALMLKRLGVFMGSNLNDSEDSLDLFDLVRYVVERHAPDFSPLLRHGDLALPFRVESAVNAHLADRPVGQRWGWKLPETGHVLPVISRLFPEARCIHLVRDGRDVAFSPFLAPKAPFWRKIYFNDDRIDSWRGLGMGQRAYRAHGHIFNAARWVNSVTLGRAHGVMLGERYLEVRYERLVSEPAAELARVAAFLGLDPAPAAPICASVRTTSVGKWRRHSAREIEEVRAVLAPTLAAFGYPWERDAIRTTPFRVKLLRWLEGGVSAGPRAEPGGLGGLFRVQDRR